MARARPSSPIFLPHRSWLLLGKPGNGKSTVSRLLVNRLLVETPDAIALVHDINPISNEHRGYGARYVFHSPEAFIRAPQKGRLNVFSGIFPPEALAPLAIQIAKRRPVILCYDELDRVVSKGGDLVDGGRDGQYDGMAGSPLYQIANYGRHRRVALVGTARRAPTVGPLFQSTAEAMFILRLDSGADLDWCARLQDRAFARRVSSLQKFEGLYRSDAGIRAFTVTPTALRWT